MVIVAKKIDAGGYRRRKPAPTKRPRHVPGLNVDLRLASIISHK
jgi:hypothetical protein